MGQTAHRLPDLTSATALYIGETAIDVAYLGATEVFSATTFEDGDALLLESGDFLLLESGDKILIDF
jgi:hypothetical protein